MGETFPWLEQAARAGLWADGEEGEEGEEGEVVEEENKEDVAKDHGAAVSTMEEMKEKWGFPRFEES